MEQGILIGGTGGQGILAAGEFLSEALFRAGYEVINSRSYGSEARGGRCRSEVIVSDSEIYDLQLEEADILIILSVPAFKQYTSRAKENALVLVDSEVLYKLEGEETIAGIHLVPISASETAKRLGNPIVANMVLLGALAKRSKLFSVEDLKGAVKGMMRLSLQEINLKAIEAGYSEA